MAEFSQKKKMSKYMEGKQGQQMMIGIMIMIMAIIVFIATIPAMKDIINNARGCQYLNCAGFVDRSSTTASCGSTNTSYSAALEEDTLACTIIGLGIPYLILGVLVGVIAKLIHGKMTEPAPPEYGYAGYAQSY